MDEDDKPDDLPNRDYRRYEGYWHGFTFIIFDTDQPDGAWIRSSYWVPVAAPEAEDDGDTGEQPD